MAKTLWASGICEKALRKIGAFSINDTGANAEEMAEAASWLDLIIAFVVETQHITWLVEDTVTFALVADQATYDVETAFGTSFPADGVLFITHASVTDGTNDEPIDIIRRKTFEAIANKTSSGTPESLYIDRLTQQDKQTISINPVPAITGKSIKIVFQKGSPNVADNSSRKRHGFPQAWQFWMVKALAKEVGDGPVRRLPRQEIRDLKDDASAAFDALQASQNRETFTPSRTRSFGA